MSANATAPSLDGVDGTANGTAATMTAFGLVQSLGFMMLEAKLLTGALGVLYVGSHAALRRPPSASPAKNRKAGKTDGEGDGVDDRFSQGLEPSDAIMFPLLAAAVLVGLYYLIVWLQDPSMLNKILRWYSCAMSIVSMVTLYAHGLELAASLVFPRYWRGRDGLLRKVDGKARSVVVCDDAGNPVGEPSTEASPLPGLLAMVACSERGRSAAWQARDLLTRHWVVKFFVRGVGLENAKIKFAHMLALPFSLATALVYFSTSSPLLSNVLGCAMCYGSFMILSSTDFLTGSLVLIGLFFYDIFMVFYTPYMVTVATTLEIPIKLSFRSGTRKSMLGLGDIVIPGMVVAWALRLDLWMYYLDKVKYESTKLAIVEKDSVSGALATRHETKYMEIKARYLDVKGTWGDWLWARGALFLGLRRQLPPELAASAFPKTYFYASMAGYALGLVCTLAMLLVFKKAQPALLYLVPGVLGSLVVTALVRGEMKSMWRYTEDGSLDTMDVVVDLDGEGNAIKTIGKLENGVVDTTKDKDGDRQGDRQGDKDKAKKDKDEAKKSHVVFMLSLEAPAEDGE